MTQFHNVGPQLKMKTGSDGRPYVDHKDVDMLRRMMTPNGKIYSRKRLGISAKEQRMVARAIRRASRIIVQEIVIGFSGHLLDNETMLLN